MFQLYPTLYLSDVQAFLCWEYKNKMCRELLLGDLLERRGHRQLLSDHWQCFPQYKLQFIAKLFGVYKTEEVLFPNV